MPKDKICCVYKITSPVGMVYVGGTIDYDRRIKQHKKSESGQKNVKKSMREHGIDSHLFEILENCTPDNLRKIEEGWIKELDACGENGMNMSAGPGTKGLSVSDKAKRAISLLNSKQVHQYALDGRYIASHSSAVIAAKNTGANSSNIGQCCIGMIHSSGGFLWSNKLAEAIPIPDGMRIQKPFYLFKKSGELVGEYNKHVECMSLGIIPSNVLRCLEGVRASVNGYVAIYKENYVPGMRVFNPRPRPTTNKMSKAVIKMDLNYNEIETYESATAAARSEGRSVSDVLKCCNGVLFRSGKNRYKYG